LKTIDFTFGFTQHVIGQETVLFLMASIYVKVFMFYLNLQEGVDRATLANGMPMV